MLERQDTPERDDDAVDHRATDPKPLGETITPPLQAVPKNATTSPTQSLLDEAFGHYRAKRFAAAVEAGRKAVALAPGAPTLWNAFGIFLRGYGRTKEAIAAFHRAVALAPHDASAWSNLGNVLTDIRSLETAIGCYDRAVAYQPRSPVFHHNLGVALRRANRLQDSVDSLSRALIFDPDNAHARLDRSMVHLHRGDYLAGWADYEARLVTGDLPARDLPGKRWRGQEFRGQRLLIVPEQGFGDALWIARYLPLVKALGGAVILEARPELIPLFEENKLVDEVVPPGKGPKDVEWSIYQCSLPGLFTHDLASIPAAPYLSASPDRIVRIRPLIEGAGPDLKVGIVWSGSVTFKNNRERAVPLTAFLESFAIPGVRLFSLQKGPPEGELKKANGAPIVDLSPHLASFADTAAALSLLDLVIMTDSSVAHLGGAMGRPVWVLLGRGSHWVWLDAGEESPWYPSLRLFRWRGAWPDVFDRAAAAVMNKIYRL